MKKLRNFLLFVSILLAPIVANARDLPNFGKILNIRDYDTCRGLLDQALKVAKDELDPVTISYSVAQLASNSILVRAGLRPLSDNSWLVPRAWTISKNLGLELGRSKVFFLEIGATPGSDPRIKGDIDDLLYHFLLIHHVVGISPPTESSNSFFHDITSHLAGFYILSKHPHWNRALKILAEALYVQHTYEDIEEIKETANDMRQSVGGTFELISTSISFKDLKGQSYADSEENFRKLVRQHEKEWNKFLGRHQITLPSIAEQQSILQRWANKLFWNI